MNLSRQRVYFGATVAAVAGIAALIRRWTQVTRVPIEGKMGEAVYVPGPDNGAEVGVRMRGRYGVVKVGDQPSVEAQPSKDVYLGTAVNGGLPSATIPAEVLPQHLKFRGPIQFAVVKAPPPDRSPKALRPWPSVNLEVTNGSQPNEARPEKQVRPLRLDPDTMADDDVDDLAVTFQCTDRIDPVTNYCKWEASVLVSAENGLRHGVIQFFGGVGTLDDKVTIDGHTEWMPEYFRSRGRYRFQRHDPLDEATNHWVLVNQTSHLPEKIPVDLSVWGKVE